MLIWCFLLAQAECPLCKQPFSSILHSVKAQDDFKEFTLRPPPAPGENGTSMMAAALVTAGAGGNPGDRRRSRRRGGAAESGRRPRERRYLGRQPGGRVLLPTPPTPPLPPPPPLHAPLLPRPEDGGMAGEGMRGNDVYEAEDPGVIFEGLTGASVPPPNDRGVQRLMVRLAARRRAQREGRTVRHLRPREMLAFRRALYRCGVRVRSDSERPRDITAAFYQRNPAALQRLHPWLQRELTVLYGAHGSLVNIVQRIITSRITHHDMAGGGVAIQDELRPFLLARTDHFLHELICFARSPLSMDTYDQLAVYDPQSQQGQVTSSSDTDDSVIAISEEEEEEEEGGGSEGERERRPIRHMPATIRRQSGAGVGDRNPPQQQEASTAGGAEEEEEEELVEECMIVGFVKPMAERTPELVQLSSDPSDQETEQQNQETGERTEGFTLPALPPVCFPIPPLNIPPASPHNPPSSDSKEAVVEKDRGGERCHPCPTVERTREGRRRRRSRPHSGLSESLSNPSRVAGPRSRPVVREMVGQLRSVGSAGISRKQLEGSNRGRASASGESSGAGSNEEAMRERGGGGRKKRERELNKHSENRHRVREQRREREKERSRCKEAVRQRSPYQPARSRYSHTGIFSSPEYLSHSTSPFRSPSRSRHSKRSRESSREHRRSGSSDSLGSSVSRLSADGQTSRHSDKPGGKRKYKTRHLEDPSWEPPSSACRRDGDKHVGRGGEESSRRSRPKMRESEKRRRPSRSPSVEIIYEGTTVLAASPSRPHHKRKHKRKQQHHGMLHDSPVIITIDSDSDRAVQTNKLADDGALDLSEHDALAFPDRDLRLSGLPPADHGLDMGVDISDLAVDILNHNSDNSHDVLLKVDDPAVDVSAQIKKCKNQNSTNDPVNCSLDAGGRVGPQVSRSTPGVSSSVTSDSRLLEAILQELEHIPLPDPDPDVTSEPDLNRNATTQDCGERVRAPRDSSVTAGSSWRLEAGTSTKSFVFPTDHQSTRSPARLSTDNLDSGSQNQSANPFGYSTVS
ncbi:hypothetical protein UPYG_G00243710 [Umbra pygmaea]|uniref:RING-type E3 ubiquitin transferase n=1 Tax=Umbra pygmaea TaxID=75934 RepID=A0ABD0WY45_UMBPY